jgi:serine/threonine protein kinase
MLLGVTLDGGWLVTQRVVPASNGTGGNFSEGYLVENADGRKAFLKALDYSRALLAPDPARALQAITETFNFERDLLNRCKGRRMDRVVVALADGTHRVAGAADGGVVQYLIFELADGDVRSQADSTLKFDLAFALRSLHHVSTGMVQLHSDNIVHQDVKPSNVLVFKGRGSKVADLGRATIKGGVPPHDHYSVAGDPTYAPPELLYGQVDPDWSRRRLGADAYLFGSMVVFFFLGQGMTTLLELKLAPPHRCAQWAGTYADVLPYVRDAFGKVLADFGSAVAPEIRPDLVAIVRELCDPDPIIRGHPRDRGQAALQYSLLRYVARFDVLARKAEGGFLRKP